MTESNEIKVVQSYLVYALPGAVITAAAAVICFIFGFVALGVIPSILCFGAVDAMFRKTVTTISPDEKKAVVMEFSLWRKSRSSTYESDNVKAITVDWVPGAFVWMLQYQVSLRPKAGGKQRVKVVHGKRSAAALRDRLATALGSS